jgi:hypothetical protein
MYRMLFEPLDKDKEPPRRVAELTDRVMRARDNYIFFHLRQKGSKVYEGYCCLCRQDIWLERVRHGENVVCPFCGKRVSAWQIGRKNSLAYFVPEERCLVLEKYAGVLVFRYFYVRWRIDENNYRNPAIRYYELRRAFIDNKAMAPKYTVAAYRKGYSGWEAVKSVKFVEYGSHIANGRDELTELVKGTYLERTPFADSCQTDCCGDAVMLAVKLFRHPCLEYMYKLGYKGLCREIVCGRTKYDRMLNLRAKSVDGIFGMPFAAVKRFADGNTTERDLHVWRYIYDHKAKVSKEDYGVLKGLLPHYSGNFYTLADTFFENVSVERLLNYLNKRSAAAKRDTGCHMYAWVDNSVERCFRDYMDYFCECMRLELDLKDDAVLYPKNFTAAHERTGKLWKTMTDAKKTAKYIKAVEKYKSWEYAANGFTVRVCGTPAEMNEEGKALRHCVGGYVDRVMEGRSVICLLRKAGAADKPYYTLEVSPVSGKLVQIRGLSNCAPTPEVRAFADSWLKYIRRPQRSKAAKQDNVQRAVSA